MTLINTLLPQTSQGPSASVGNLQLRLETPLPPLSPGQTLTATVSKSSLNGQLMLTLPDGTQVQAAAQPPLAAGTQLTFSGNGAETTPSPAPSPSQVSPPPPLPPGAQPAKNTAAAQTPSPTQQVTVQITLPGGISLPPLRLNVQNVGSATLLQSAGTPNSSITAPSSPLPPLPGSSSLPPLQPTQGQNPAVATQPLSLPPSPTGAQTQQLPSTLSTITLIPANISANNPQKSLQTPPQTQQNIPQGPIDFSYAQQPKQTIPLNQPLQLTLQTATSGRLAINGQSLTINFPTPFPAAMAGQTLPVTFTANPNAPQNPTLLLTAEVELPPQAAKATLQQQPAQPTLPPPLSALKAILSPGQPAPVPLNTPVAARVLATPPNQPPTQGQPLLLATGHRAVLQSPQPLMAGSIVVVEFPVVTGPAQVVQVQSGGGQPATQPNTQGAATPQVQQPAQALPPGLQVQGVISGQTSQGQPLLTIQAPPQYAGQTLAVNLPPEAQHHLPVGTQMALRLTEGGNASVLSLVLPQAAQRANTLTFFGEKWQGLQQALSLLQTHAPELAQGLRNQLPQLQTLLPGFLMFVDALRRNSAEQTLGKEAHTLLKSLGLDLTSDVGQLAQLQQRQEDTQWRGTLFPYVENPGEDPRQGGFFWRREKKDEARSRTSTRFIMQLNLSRMGEVQLDGLVNYPEIWLKLRRTTPPEEGFITQLQSLVNDTLEQYGLQGGITVETAPTFPVNPLAEVLAGTPNPLPTNA